MTAAVSGSVHVKNVGSAATQNLMITDVVQANDGNGGFEEIAKIAVDTSKKPVLAAGEEGWYPFTVYFKHVDGATYQNIERVSISNLVDKNGQALAAENVMNVKASVQPLQAVGQDASATITDTWATPNWWLSTPSTVGPWYVNDNTTIPYDIVITNNVESGIVNLSMMNTAKLVENDSKETTSASATVWLSTQFSPEIKIVKSAPTCVARGDPITYTFTVYNIGNSPLTDVVVTDPMFPGSLNHVIGAMAAGTNVSFSASYPTDASTVSPLTNTATVLGKYFCLTVSNSSAATVNVVNAGMSIEKSGPTCVNLYGSINWTIEIKNTGDVELTNLNFVDPSLGVTKTQEKLAVGGVWSFILPDQAGGTIGEINNSAYVTASTACNVSLNVTDWHVVQVNNAAIKIVKTGGPDPVDTGATITWAFNVTNIGLTPLTNVLFTDANLTISNMKLTDLLAPGESITWTNTSKAPDVIPPDGKVYNTAIVTGQSTCGQNVIDVSSSDDSLVHLQLAPTPSIEIFKTGPDCGSAQVGSVITWSIAIHNNGALDLTNVVFSDPMIGNMVEQRGNLAIGAWDFFNITSNAPQTSQKVNNVGFVTADSAGGPVAANSGASVNVINPSIEITKGGPNEVEPLGVIDWTFSVHNNGDVPLVNVTVNDPLLGMSWTHIGTLAKGATWDFDYNGGPLAPEQGEVYNQAFVTGESPCAIQVSDSDDHIVQVHLPCECLKVWKTVDKSVAHPGDTVTYSYSIFNCNYPGPTPCITNLWIRDRAVSENGCEVMSFDVKSGDTIGDKSVMVPWGLAPNEWFNFTVTVPISSEWTHCCCGDWLNNTVYVDGCCCGKFIQNHASASVNVLDCCSVRIDKYSDVNYAMPGDFINYTLKVTNTGMNKLCSLNITEKCLTDKPIVLCNLKCDLYPCESMWYNFTYQVPWNWTCCKDNGCPGDNNNNLVNTANVCAYCPDCRKWVSDSDTNTVTITVPPRLEVTKTANVDEVTFNPNGDTYVYYTIVVKNVGCVPITCISVSDDMLWCKDKTICCLGPCQSYTFKEIRYELPCSWSHCKNGDWLNNTVTVNGWACDIPVSASASESVKVIDKFHLKVDKIGPEVAYEGQNITYQITVRNVGSEEFAEVLVQDTMLNWSEDIGCLMPCESRSWNVTYHIPETDCKDCDKQYELADCGCCKKDYWVLKNEVVATGWRPSQNVMVVDTDTECVKVMNPCNVEIEILGPEFAQPGDNITFSVGVINAGNKTLLELEPTVWICDKEYCLGKICYLDPGKEMWFTINYSVPACQCGVCPNGAVGDGIDTDGAADQNAPCHAYNLYYKARVTAECCCNDVKVSDCVKGHVHIQGCCGIEVTKTGPESAEPGQIITWTITVTNTGVKPLCWVQVCDEMTGFYMDNLTLGAGESLSWPVTYQVPMDWYYCDHKKCPVVTNTVHVQAWCCWCNDWLKDCSKDSVKIIDNVSLVITKTVVPTSTVPTFSSNGDCPLNLAPKPGDVVWYRVTVTNMGMRPISCIEVYDDLYGYVGHICCLCPVCCDGPSVTFDYNYTIPDDWTYCKDGCILTNTVTADGYACGEKVSVSATKSIEVNVDHIIQVFKTGPETASPGEDISYQISVHNAGKQAVCNVVAIDYISKGIVAVGFSSQDVYDRRCIIDKQTIGCLAPCEWYNYTVNYTVPEDWTCEDGFWLFNNAMVRADACCPCEKLSDYDYWMTAIENISCAVDVEKCAPRNAEPGDWVTYTIKVHNPNCKAISCVHVVDATIGLDTVIPCIEPFKTVYIPVKFQVPENWSYCANGDKIVNEVDVGAWCCNHYVTDSDTHTMWIMDPCDLRVTKTSDVQKANPGDVITYTITVQNAGSSVLSSVMVTDKEVGLCDVIERLMPCESKTYTVTATVPIDWTHCHNGEWFNNTVCATGWCCCERTGKLIKVCDTACDSVYVNCLSQIKVCKELISVDGVPYKGQEINTGQLLNWSIKVCNTGYYALSEVTVYDILTRCDGTQWVLMDQIIDENLENCTCKTVWVEFKAPTGCCNDFMLNNSVTVTAYALTTMVTASDYYVVTVQGECELTVEKNVQTKSGDGTAFSGEPVKYTIEVSNTGSKPLTCVNVTDDRFPGWYAYYALINVGGSKKITLWDYNWTLPCNGTAQIVNNTAYAKAQCCGQDSGICCDIVASDSASFLLKPQYALDLQVVISDRSCCKPGGWVYYDVYVTNTGNHTLEGFHLRDILGVVNITVTDPLKKGATWHETYKMQTPVGWNFCDNGTYLNDTFSVQICTLCGSVEDSQNTSWEICSPCMLINKVAYVNGKEVKEVWPGQVVTYVVTVRNVGGHAITCLNIEDKMFRKSKHIDCLEACENYTFSYNITVPEWFCCWGDYLNNTVKAWGYCNYAGCCDKLILADCEECASAVVPGPGDDGGSDGTCPDCDKCPSCMPKMVRACDKNSLFVHNEFHLVVWKDADVERCVMPGDWINYTITVVNAGTINITNVFVNDTMLGLHKYIPCMSPCQKIVYTVMYQVPKDWSNLEDGNVIINNVTAVGYQHGVEQSVWATETVYVFDPCDVRITITAPETAYNGESITYTVVVKNHGANTAFNVWVYDPVLGINDMIWCLEPTESRTYTRTIDAPDCDGINHYINNTVVVKGCCCGQCHCSRCMPDGGQGGFELSVLPDLIKPEQCCHVFAQASWSVMIVCSCCG